MHGNRFSVKSKDIRWLTQHAFASKKRKTIVCVDETVTFHTTHWFEGSKNEYVAVMIADGSTIDLPTGTSPWNDRTEGKTVKLMPGIAIVEKSTFCGRELPLTVWIHPDNVAAFLTATKEE